MHYFILYKTLFSELTNNSKEIKRSNNTFKEKIKQLQNTLQSLKNQYTV